MKANLSSAASFIASALLLSAPVFSQSPARTNTQATIAPPPNQFEIARDQFFEGGPPHDFYDLYVVSPTPNGTSIQRITLTPAADKCTMPATVETASATLSESIPALLGNGNPCAIPEKEITREPKPCKKCPHNLTGTVIAMQIECGLQTRLIRSDVLDQHMFGPASKKSDAALSTEDLLRHLDQALAPKVTPKPATPNSGAEPLNSIDPGSPIIQDLKAGNYNPLFTSAPDKPSEIFRAAQNTSNPLSVKLLSSTPLVPEGFIPPEYPEEARLARIEGTVTFSIEINSAGRATNLILETGPEKLQETIKDAIKSWRFPKTAVNQIVEAAIQFTINCPK
jgi:TonB family protein